MFSEEGATVPGSSTAIEAQEGYERIIVGMEEQESEEFVQDQIIIAPEIMSKVLDQLDIRSLKKVRLVCKSWLLEAQVHLEQKTTVRLNSRCHLTRIQDFLDITNKRNSSGIPQPFKSIYFRTDPNELPPESLVTQLSSLPAPLEITRFSLQGLAPKLVYALILRYSSSMENLQLCEEVERAECLPWMDPEQRFPKLKYVSAINWSEDPDAFMLITWLVKGSSRLETLELYRFTKMELLGQLLLQENLKNHLRRLDLYSVVRDADVDLSSSVLETFASISFRKFQNLQLFLIHVPNITDWGIQFFLQTVAKSAETLTVLDLTLVRFDEEDLGKLRFPVCPNLRELSVSDLGLFEKRILPHHHLPSLQVLSIRYVHPGNTRLLKRMSPFEGVKTLRVRDFISSFRLKLQGRSDMGDKAEFDFHFFNKFPALERLKMSGWDLEQCCRLKASGNPTFSSLLEGVKHMELSGYYDHFRGCVRTGAELSFLAVLNGIETIAMNRFQGLIATIPVRYLPSLKMIRFPWWNCSGIEDIVEMIARGGVERVVITNCCSAPRVIGDERSLELLETFFKSVPIAECGCGEWESRKWYSYH